jgi:hypothetical protein
MITRITKATLPTTSAGVKYDLVESDEGFSSMAFPSSSSPLARSF